MNPVINIENWQGRKKILIILAHPDDPEFFCGAMIARWCQMGHEVQYCLLTKGQKGSQDPVINIGDIEKTRVAEQNNAARVLGVSKVDYLDLIDGELVADLTARETIIRVIREVKPDVVVTSDPQNLFPAENRINHPDHRAAGQAVVDAVFPAAGNPRYFTRNNADEIQFPHQVEEIWITLTHQPNLTVDLTTYFDQKIKALLCHSSQIRESRDGFIARMKTRFEADPKTGKNIFAERFKRIILK